VLRIRAGRVHPVTAPSFEDGAVLVDAAGRIAAVGSDTKVPKPRGAQSLHYPDAELLPGLVNCHTHLELTHLGGGARHDEPEFPKWIRRIRELKDAMSVEAFYEAAVAGVRDCWARGVTCVAETGSTSAVMRALHDLGGRGIVYQEAFGPDPATCVTGLFQLKSVVHALRPFESAQRRLGVSPHAPYTVSTELYQAVAEYARRENLPVAVHVAESREETALVQAGEGPFADALRGRGIAIEAHGCSPVAYLSRLGLITRGALCIHCVQVNEADIQLLRTQGASVAHCPRSNIAHRHGRMPLELFRKAGVPTGIGTDSVVSVGDLDLWAEAEAAGFVGDAAIRALTFDGACALGWESEIGSLEVGKAGDLVVQAEGPSGSQAVLTVIAGRIVHRAGSPQAR